MDAKRLVTQIHRLYKTQNVMIRFAEEGMTGLHRLHSLIMTDARVSLNNSQKALMYAVLESRRWNGSDSRTYKVCGLSHADTEWLTQVARDVECVDTSPHGAKMLMSGRQKMRQEATMRIVASVLTADFIQEMSSWGLTVIHVPGELEGLPLLSFKVRLADEVVASVAIDGWSGRIAINGTFTNGTFYTYPEQIQHILRMVMEKALEKLTAA